MIEIKIDLKKQKGTELILSSSLLRWFLHHVSLQHGSEYIKKESSLGTSPNMLFVCGGGLGVWCIFVSSE